VSIQPTNGFISVNGLRLHYLRWSPDAVHPHFPPILLLHGLASSAHIWNFVAPLLAEQGYNVTALDQRGHGESDKPDSGYDFASIIADDRAVVDALAIERPIVVGHSWGAMVALEYAATFAEDTIALVLVDGATNQFSRRPDWSREQALIDLAPPRFAGTPRATFLSYFKRGPLGQQWSPELEDSILHIVQLRDDDTVAPRLAFDNHLHIIGAMWDQPLFDLYQQVRCPITLIVAEQELPSEATEAMRVREQMRNEGIAHIQTFQPSIRIVRMANTIHDIPLQRPQQLAQEILSSIPSQV
jgi:pimeloyl-ACP methyl ester carboxylesterase